MARSNSIFKVLFFPNSMLSGVMAAASLWVKECGGVGGNEKKRAGRSQVADVTDKAREAEPQK